MQGNTGLHLAAAYGHTEMIDLLLAAEAKVNAANKKRLGNTPLMVACCNKHAGAASALLKSLRIDITLKNKYGETALDYANQHGATECAELLKDFMAAAAKKKVDQNLREHAVAGDAAGLEEAIQAGANIEATNKSVRCFIAACPAAAARVIPHLHPCTVAGRWDICHGKSF